MQTSGGAQAADAGTKAPWNKRPRTVLVPVRCPECGKSTSMRSAWIVVDTALSRWNHMKLKAACCRVSWNASTAEVDEIRRHVGHAGTQAPGRD
jgi:hypothetical protein